MALLFESQEENIFLILDEIKNINVEKSVLDKDYFCCLLQYILNEFIKIQEFKQRC